MRVHAFLATADALPRLLEAGTAPPTSAVLNGVDPINLASLVEIVTAGSVGNEEASAALENPVLTAGPRGPSIDLLPPDAAVALGARTSPCAPSGSPSGRGGTDVRTTSRRRQTLAQVAASRRPEQDLFLWVADGP
ncbi:MAG TPA: hypothetical protein VGF31_02295 [Myxococcaceae bacterium]